MSSNKKKRGTGFTQAETLSFLDTLESAIPIGPDDWSQVEATHLEKWPDTSRDVASLRRKFQALYRKKAPTGDPTCPPEIKKAKSIMFHIRERAECDDNANDSDGDDSFLAGVLARRIEPTETACAESVQVERELMDTSQLSSATSSSSSNSPPVAVASLPRTGEKRFFSTSPQMRQVTRKRQGSSSGINGDGEFSFQDFMKYSMMQRELDRQEREKERREEREKRAEENRAFNQMMLCLMGRTSKPTSRNED